MVFLYPVQKSWAEIKGKMLIVVRYAFYLSIFVEISGVCVRTVAVTIYLLIPVYVRRSGFLSPDNTGKRVLPLRLEKMCMET